jgi:hypothetical protein
MPRIEKQFFEAEMEEANEFTHLYGQLFPPTTASGDPTSTDLRRGNAGEVFSEPRSSNPLT